MLHSASLCMGTSRIWERICFYFISLKKKILQSNTAFNKANRILQILTHRFSSVYIGKNKRLQRRKRTGEEEKHRLFVLFESEFSLLAFSGGSDSKESACHAGDPSSIPGSGRFPGEGNGNPLQYSGLENPIDMGAWWATVRGVSKSQTWLNQLITQRHTHTHTSFKIPLCMHAIFPYLDPKATL